MQKMYPALPSSWPTDMPSNPSVSGEHEHVRADIYASKIQRSANGEALHGRSQADQKTFVLSFESLRTMKGVLT